MARMLSEQVTILKSMAESEEKSKTVDLKLNIQKT